MKKPGDITIVYENNDLLAINKPPFLAVHPGFNKTNFTLIHWIDKKYPPKGSVVLLNRIDKDTSGLVLAGKNKVFVNRFNASIYNKIYKEYMVVAKTSKRPLTVIDKPLKMLYEKNKLTQPAKTLILSQEALRFGVSLYRVVLETGRTHQIRRHFQMVGCPVAGDWLYGDQDLNKIFREKFDLHRQFLHAYKMKIPGFPELVAPLAEDLEKALTELRK